MPDPDLYNLTRLVADKPGIVKRLIFALVEKLLQNEASFTDAQRQKLAQLRAYIQINFNDF